ncbi:MAG: TraB/GumN family protein, partial [bacterium]|nr:TraB/GumN family protein [bacterium]
MWGQNKTDSTNKGFFWEIEYNNQKSYMLASIGYFKKEFYPVRNVVKDNFAKSEILAVTVDDSTDEKNARIAGFVAQKSVFQQGELLENEISAKTLQLVSEKIASLTLDSKNCRISKPWAMGLAIFGVTRIRKDFMPHHRLSKHFSNKATSKKMAIVELEGLDTFGSFYDGLSKDESEQFLLFYLNIADKMDYISNEIIQCWKTGDVKRIQALFANPLYFAVKSESLRKKMYADKNNALTTKIVSFLKTGKKHFFIFGIDFMVGQKGVIKLLKDKGVKIRQI